MEEEEKMKKKLRLGRYPMGPTNIFDQNFKPGSRAPTINCIWPDFLVVVSGIIWEFFHNGKQWSDQQNFCKNSLKNLGILTFVVVSGSFGFLLKNISQLYKMPKQKLLEDF